MRDGVSPIVEEGIDEMLSYGLGSGLLTFSLLGEDDLPDAEFWFLCLPTPQSDDGSADLTYIETAAQTIGPKIPAGSVVINKSTVPVGTAESVFALIGRDDVSVVSNPEFLREGTAINDFLHPDRVVVGSSDEEAATRVAMLYAKVAAPAVICGARSAELIKYGANSFLATKLSYVNAVAELCELLGADADDVMMGIGLDKRIGQGFLQPGPGWGGSCFPKDTSALLKIAETVGYDFAMLEEARRINVEQFDRTAGKVEDIVADISSARIGVWGLTFKSGTDDLRDSPAIEVVSRLLALGANVVAYDPTVTEPLAELPGLEIVKDPYSAVSGADALVVLTEWPEFQSVDLGKVGELMPSRQIVDGRNHLHRRALERYKFNVVGVGR